MARSNTRRRIYQSKRGDEEYAQDTGKPAAPESGPEVDSVIADIAKGFVAAQAKLSSAPPNSGNQEMLQLLQKISQQLENLDQPRPQEKSEGRVGPGTEEAKRPNQGGAAMGGQGVQPSQTGAAPSQAASSQADLASLFSRLLAPNPQSGQQPATSSGQQQEPSGQQQGGEPLTAQTAAQVIAQAQYELANELEASLTKLKEVISESEKLAEKIGNLLGEEKNAQ